MILDKIVTQKTREVALLKSVKPVEALRKELGALSTPRDFKKALSPDSSGTAIRIIAEIKKASPSRGVIRHDFDPVSIARSYQENGAAALSVLTDKTFFQGDIEYIKQIKTVTHIPILEKDFIVDEYQIYHARVYGADAVLLIAAILTDDQMRGYLNLVAQLNLHALVEVHTLEELQRVLATDAQIIGINNRDLKTFHVNTDTSLALAQHIPGDKIVVSESGIESKEVILALQERGIDAFLIGEALMREKDVGKRLSELLN